jgi:hypothetical protein
MTTQQAASAYPPLKALRGGYTTPCAAAIYPMVADKQGLAGLILKNIFLLF